MIKLSKALSCSCIDYLLFMLGVTDINIVSLILVVELLCEHLNHRFCIWVMQCPEIINIHCVSMQVNRKE